MSLKTDYKDAMYDGQRRYRLIPNEDGTYSLPDATTYTQQGDKFGANDINSTNTEINRMDHVTEVTLTADGWEGQDGGVAPFFQAVDVPGANPNLDAILVGAMPLTSTPASAKEYTKAFGIITSGFAEIQAGEVIFVVFKRPTTDIKIGLKGV